jgi:colanic acid/amylovoran biosynthesis protein
MNNIVITGITGLRNRGVEALVTTTIEQLQRRQPNWGVSVLTNTPDYDRVQLQGYHANPVSDSLQSIRKSFIQQLRAKCSHFYKSVAPEYQIISQAKGVIASGGDMFSSDVGATQLSLALRPLELALHAHVPVIFLAQSIGPFNKSDREKWLKLARQSHLITVREEISYSYLTKDLGLPTSLVKKTADSAFLLNPPSSEYVDKLLQFYGINRERPTVAVAVSQGISLYSQCDREQHIQSWCKVIKTIVNELDAQVLVIPHVQEVWEAIDDRILATNILKALDFDPRVRLVGGSHSASEFKGLIGVCDLVIAERMHAAIAGLSSGVCTVAVGYSIKAEGIMSDLLGKDSAHNGLLISIKDFLNCDLARETILTAWQRRNEITTQLQAVLPRVKQEAESNFDLIVQVLNQYSLN